MSWLFSQALVEAFSGASSSDGEPCVPLSVMPTPHKFWRNDKTMECSSLSRFGLMCAVLTEDRGAELLKLYQEASLALTSPAPAREQGSMAKHPAFGASLPGSLARFDLNGSLWRTPLSSLFEGLDEFSGTWPRWGSMRNGVCWERMTLVPRTDERGSGSWVDPETGRLEHHIPTPMANNLPRSPKARDIHKSSPRLVDFVRANPNQLWPTPKARDHNPEGLESGRRRNSPCLVTVVKTPDLWPTPNAGDFKAGMSNAPNRQQSSLPRTVGMLEGVSEPGRRGGLNPTFPEWLMGWPINWTALKPSETARFPEWLQWHGKSSTAA